MKTENYLPKTKSINQIWLGKSPIPVLLKNFSVKWQELHEDWEYFIWNDNNVVELIKLSFANQVDNFNSLMFNTQKVDLIKYILLYERGGLYIDFDCECLKKVDELITSPICIGLESRDERLHNGFDFYLGSAFMYSEPKQIFFKELIEKSFLMIEKYKFSSRYDYVMETTGPTLLNRFYTDYGNKESINLLKPELIGPFRQKEATLYRENKRFNYGHEKLINTYVIHHFFSSWLK